MLLERDLPESDDSYDFINVGQNQFGATSKDRLNPTIKTFGLAGCAGLAIYDPDTKTGAIAHISPSVLMAHKMQEASDAYKPLQHRSGDHLQREMYKLLYILEDNGVHNARYSERGNLVPWLVCSYEELREEIFRKALSAKLNLDKNHIFSSPELNAIALDTQKGNLLRLKPPVLTNMQMDRLDIFAAQSGALVHTKDSRSL